MIGTTKSIWRTCSWWMSQLVTCRFRIAAARGGAHSRQLGIGASESGQHKHMFYVYVGARSVCVCVRGERPCSSWSNHMQIVTAAACCVRWWCLFALEDGSEGLCTRYLYFHGLKPLFLHSFFLTLPHFWWWISCWRIYLITAPDSTHFSSTL